MRRANAWIFDLDDTLTPNVHDYADSILDSCRLIIKILGAKAPHVFAIVELEREIDCQRVDEVNPVTGKVFGYTMERFPGSLVEVYRTICKRAEAMPTDSVEQELYKIGLQAFDPNRYAGNVFPDTTSTLDFLRLRGDEILLLTKGDQKIQELKLSALDAENRFYRVKIVESRKTPEVFRKMAESLEGYQLFSVGNDYEKDIVPALEAGYRGVWIPLETWEVIGRLDEIRVKVDQSRCVELRSLRELVERYDEIVGTKTR